MYAGDVCGDRFAGGGGFSVDDSGVLCGRGLYCSAFLLASFWLLCEKSLWQRKLMWAIGSMSLCGLWA